MKKVILLLLLIPLLGIAQQQNDRRILHMWELTIKPNEGEKFQQGMKNWKDCYLQNEGVDSWNVWNRVQGMGNVVAVTLFMDKWAEMDSDDDQAGQACRSIFVSEVFPHVEKMEHHMAYTMPEFSRTSGERPNVVRVSFFRIKDRMSFEQVVKDVVAVYRDAEGQPHGNWYDYIGGGPDSPDYMVARPYQSFSQMDEQEESPWQAYSKKHGEAKMKETQEKFRQSLDDSWSYIYRLNKELSRDPQS